MNIRDYHLEAWTRLPKLYHGRIVERWDYIPSPIFYSETGARRYAENIANATCTPIRVLCNGREVGRFTGEP